MTNLISIVIPAFNAEATIAVVVDAARNQDLAEELEVIVVDDGSVDQTAAKAQGVGARVIRQTNMGPAAARNTGWRAARGEVVLFTDSDCRPQREWARNLLAGFSSPAVGAVAGSYGIWNSGSWLARQIHEEIVKRHDRMGKFVRVFGSYNVAIRSDVLEKLNGFNEAYQMASGEDNDLSYRILKDGFTIGFRREALVDHLHQESLYLYLKEQARHGYWRMLIYRTHPRTVCGDDYTRAKDIAEPPLALTLLALGLGSMILGGTLTNVALGLALVYCLLQVIPLTGEVWNTAGTNRWPYAAVTFLRGFARGLGMAAGIVRFGLKNPIRQ
jgi:glycosyltransferase involved in cell wall biosynthesis